MTDEAIQAVATRLRKQVDKGHAIRAEIAALKQMLDEALDERDADCVKVGKLTVRRVTHTQMRFDAKALAKYDQLQYEAFLRPVTVTKLEVVS